MVLIESLSIGDMIEAFLEGKGGQLGVRSLGHFGAGHGMERWCVCTAKCQFAVNTYHTIAGEPEITS